MISEFYFFDQYSRASHIGGVHRSKRDLEDFNQALYHLKVNLSTEDNQQLNERENLISSTIKKEINKPMLPDVLTKQLDNIFQTYDNQSKSSEEDISNNNSISNISKISLPSSLILQLHSTWSDLIQNTNYKYKVWRTKTGEESWRQYVEKRRSQQINLIKQEQNINDNKLSIHRRKSSRLSITSIGNIHHRQSITANSKTRLSRSFSRASFVSTSSLLKSFNQGTTENIVEPIKNGIHVEFKLSIQDEQTKQKIVLFDVPKPDGDFYQDIITSTQNKCKRLLAETKQKILETTYEQNNKYSKICRIWFYGDNQFLRHKNNTFNEINRRQKSKFVLSILRNEIPEKYNIHINIPETKQKCYIELIDGSIQIYYPSGRLAVLRLRPPISTTLFYDDIDSPKKQFLGLVTSTGNVLLMQPTFHARFITNHRDEYAYLCNGKTGFIEKEFNYSNSNSNQRQSISIDQDNINYSSSLFKNTIQFQINSFMQLEYHNSSNILFAFKCQDEQFKFQLGTHLSLPSPTLNNLTTTTISNNKNSLDKKFQFLSNRSNSIINNDLSNISQKQTQKYSNENHQLPILQDLILLRKRIKNICHSWLKQCRTTLGIMNIDDYCLSDLPKQQISLNNHFVKTINREQILTTKFESNVISNAIEQFIPHSNTGRIIKQQIYRKKILPTTLPLIK